MGDVDSSSSELTGECVASNSTSNSENLKKKDLKIPVAMMMIPIWVIAVTNISREHEISENM